MKLRIFEIFSRGNMCNMTSDISPLKSKLTLLNQKTVDLVRGCCECQRICLKSVQKSSLLIFTVCLCVSVTKKVQNAWWKPKI